MVQRETTDIAALTGSRTPTHRGAYPGLPMPHKVNARRSGKHEKEEYARRRQAHLDRYPDYDDRFNRPPIEVFNKAWKLVHLWLPKEVAFLKGREKSVRALAPTPQEKVALVVLVDLFINAARSGRGVTYNEVFDEVCRKYSDHFVGSLAFRSRDMRPITLKNARRDLLCNYIDINKLWAAFRSMQTGEQFFTVTHDGTSDSSSPLRVALIQNKAVEEFTALVAETPRFFSSRNRGVLLSFRYDKDGQEPREEIPESEKFCAEASYNWAKPTTRSLKSIELQSQSTLLFDVDTFKADFDKATKLEETLRTDILKQYKIDPRISNKKMAKWQQRGRGGAWVKTELWSRRERLVYYSSIVEGFKKPLYSAQITTFYRKKRNQIRKEESETKRERRELTLKQRYEAFVVWLVDGCAAPVNTEDHDKDSLVAVTSWQQGLDALVRSRRNAVKHEYERKWSEFITQPTIEETSDDDPDGDKRPPRKPTATATAKREKRLADFERGRAFLSRLREARGNRRRRRVLEAEDVIRASIAGWEWRQSVRAAMAQYDRVRDFCRLYRAANVQLKDRSGILPIRSRFYMIINRRYQPRNMWPTYVGDWSTGDDTSGEQAYRKRWFKARHPLEADADCPLVGYCSARIG
jgi:hypothetical protein